MADSLHIIGSKQFGGADHFYVRLVQALNECGHRAVAVNRPGTPISEALDGAVEQTHVPMRNVWDLLSVWAIRRLIRETGALIVQTYMGRATRLTRVPRSSRAIHVARLGNLYKIKGYYEHADAWIGNTSRVCDYLVDSGLPSDRIFLISNFVEIPPRTPAETVFRLRESLEIPLEAMTLFALGRFIEIKGLDDLLLAFARLPDEINGRPLHLIIAGDGPLRKKLHGLAASLGLSSRLSWVGWQDNPCPYYDAADVFVCPSRHETLGNVILEAWAHGLPVITTKTPGALELIEQGENGLLVSCNSVADLRSGLYELLTAPASYRKGLAQKGMERLSAAHSEEAVVRSFLDLYEELKKKGPRRRSLGRRK
jgi:glycosyltransferase involved in cell wall biosynthesis